MQRSGLASGAGKSAIDVVNAHSARSRLRDVWIAFTISPHFDTDFYLAQLNPSEAPSNPPLHYVRRGAALGLDPTKEFSTSFYLSSNLDVLRSGVNPFWHYLKHGIREGRAPHPSLARQEPQVEFSAHERDLDLLHGHFDAVFYRANYENLPESDAELPAHYLTVGWLLGYDPNDWFSTQGYLRANPDVADARSNPFIHYILHGLEERRPLTRDPRPATERLNLIDNTMARIRDAFDADFYLSVYPDVAKAQVDPLFHYCAEGWREGRDPCAGFSTRHYLESNPDVLEAGLNPFEHYIGVGRSEGRSPKHPASEELEVLRRHNTLADVVQEWTRHGAHPPLLAEDEIEALLSEEIGGGRLILSFSHDNYLVSAGGIQLCIQAEEALVREKGDSYLVIFPWQALPRLSHYEVTPDVVVELALNGRNVGVTRTSALIQVVARLALAGHEAVPVIHQILGHNPEQIVSMVKACGRGDCVMWLHDFVTLCPKFSLQRNDLAFCGAPPPESNACHICLYGEERAAHLRRIEALFAELDVHLISPSASARDFWNARRTVEPSSITVRPHVKLSSVRRTPDVSKRTTTRPIRVGYLGAPMAHKGWNDFRRLAEDLDGKGFEFYHFAKEKSDLPAARFVSVHVRAGATNAMVEALRQADIDLVIHWASWPETFSFTTFEALAAGAFVLTNSGSGNVAAAVKKNRRGCVLDDIAALEALFADKERLRDLVATRRESADGTALHMTFSQMSLPSIERLAQ